MIKDLKVCFVVGTLGRGGAERQLLYMLQALKNSGVNARVLCLTEGESYEKEIKSLGIPVEWVGQSQNRVSRLVTIIKNLKKNPADILQSSHFYTNIYVGLAGKAGKVPSIGAIRSDLNSEIKFHKYLGKWQILLPSFLIVNSEFARARAIERGISSEKVEFVHNVVKIEPNRQKETANSGQGIKILFVGRLDKNKRPERFIQLAAVLKRKFTKHNLEFQIAGDGVLRNELEILAEKLNLSSEKLKFLGVCSDMSKIYRQADILVSTSEREGTSNVILEAMAYEIPVIATRIGGTPEILDETRGMLIEPGNEKNLVESTTKLIVDKDLRKRLGAEGRKYIENNHSIERLETKLTTIYKSLVG
ncbi:MAG: glycosyltransferase [Acidobacteriota bacterium]